jgi:hypothetical protein
MNIWDEPMVQRVVLVSYSIPKPEKKSIYQISTMDRNLPDDSLLSGKNKSGIPSSNLSELSSHKMRKTGSEMGAMISNSINPIASLQNSSSYTGKSTSTMPMHMGLRPSSSLYPRSSISRNKLIIPPEIGGIIFI